MKVGWIGNYKRAGKSFDIAFKTCKEYGHDLSIAGGTDTSLYLSREEVAPFIRKQDVILSTSAFEAHPLIMYEALACGVPFVCERNVGDGFINNVRGVAYYQGFNTKSIQDALVYVRDNHTTMSLDAIEEIHENWLWSKVKPQYDHMFRNFSGEDNPHVTWVIDSPGWAWDFMMQEIKEYVWENMDIVYTVEKDWAWYMSEPFNDTDIVVNLQMHDKRLMGRTENDKPIIPVKKHILSVNGPAFVNQNHMGKFLYHAKNCSAITTVSRDILRYLSFLERPLYYATRGVDIKKFHP